MLIFFSLAQSGQLSIACPKQAGSRWACAGRWRCVSCQGRKKASIAMTEHFLNARDGRGPRANLKSRFRPRAFSLAVASVFALPLGALPVSAQTLPGGASVVN